MVDSNVEASRERVRRPTSGLAAPAAIAEADARPGEEPREKAFGGVRGSQMKKKCQTSLRIITGVRIYKGLRRRPGRPPVAGSRIPTI